MKRVAIFSVLVGFIIIGCGQTDTTHKQEKAIADSLANVRKEKSVLDSINKVKANERKVSFPGHVYSTYIGTDLREDIIFDTNYKGIRSYHDKNNPNSETHKFTWGYESCVLNDGSCRIVTTDLPERTAGGVMIAGGEQHYYGILNTDSIISLSNGCDNYQEKALRLKYWQYYSKTK